MGEVLVHALHWSLSH